MDEGDALAWIDLTPSPRGRGVPKGEVTRRAIRRWLQTQLGEVW